MINNTIFVNASNCHQGGGKTLLDGFIKGAIVSTNNYVFFIDKRYKINLPSSNKNIKYFIIPKLFRIFIFLKIKNYLKNGDIVFYFGNLPPIIKFKKINTILMLSSRFYVDNLSILYYPTILSYIKINLEKLYFKLTIHNVNKIIVQTDTMKKLVQYKYKYIKTIVLPYDDLDNNSDNLRVYNKEKNTFIYVASLLPYKNHKRLIKAWNILKNEGISPKLFLTIDNDNKLKKWIKFYIRQNSLNNIILLENIDRNVLLNYYEKCEILIYPTFFEAYGLPLVEAKKYNLKILTSDLSFCCDFIKPDDIFNPFDIESISRSVKRILKIDKIKNYILTPTDFIKKIENI